MEVNNEQEFLKAIEPFNEVYPTKADELLERKDGKIVFIGRPTCQYCRKFVGKLNEVAEDKDLEIYYVNSEHPEYTEELEQFRSKYDVPTVPGFIYSNEKETKSKSDSSMSKEEIASFVGA